MEAFAAIGAASAVLTFVEFGIKLVSKGKEYYESAEGVLADHAERSAVSSKLSDLTNRLSRSISSRGSGKKLTPAEAALLEVTEDCQSTADEFIVALDELKVSGPNRKWKSFRQALKSIWKKEGLQQIEAKLDRLRQQVVIHLLVVMKYGNLRALHINRDD
jgi:hypothetical protein